MDWKPIETAPKDGRDVHLWVRGSLVPVAGYYISRAYLQREYDNPDHMEEGWYPSFGYPFDCPEVTMTPTHWMPLPPPPQ